MHRLHYCCAWRKKKTLPAGRKSTARTEKQNKRTVEHRGTSSAVAAGLRSTLQKYLDSCNDSSFCVLPSRIGGRIFTQDAPDVQILCCICLCFSAREAGKFPAGPFAISYTFFPQSRFIVSLLEGQRTRLQPKYTEALFMLAADGSLLGRDPEDPGSHCLESNQTPVKVLQNYHVGKS